MSPDQGFLLWANQYDSAPNPLTALEARVLGPRLTNLTGLRILDLGTGTGRWLRHLRAERAQAFGIDRSDAMLRAGGNADVAIADLTALPFPDHWADLALCCLTLSYVAEFETALSEIARVARGVIISDLHPDAQAAGWQRGKAIQSFAWGVPHIESILGPAAWHVDAPFGDPERPIFEAAGKDFGAVSRINAIYAAGWSLS